MKDANVEIVKKGYRCLRCDHEWVPRKSVIPIICPNCKSPYWNRSKEDKK